MRLGMFMQPVHDPKRDLSQVLEEDRQTVIMADKLGYHEFWIGEHHTMNYETILIKYRILKKIKVLYLI